MTQLMVNKMAAATGIYSEYSEWKTGGISLNFSVSASSLGGVGFNTGPKSAILETLKMVPTAAMDDTTSALAQQQAQLITMQSLDLQTMGWMSVCMLINLISQQHKSITSPNIYIYDALASLDFSLKLNKNPCPTW